MEKRKLPRILGILVVSSLVVILLPLLFGKNSTPLQAKTLVNTPNALEQQTFNPKDFDLPLPPTRVIAQKQSSQPPIPAKVTQPKVLAANETTSEVNPTTQWTPDSDAPATSATELSAEQGGNAPAQTSTTTKQVAPDNPVTTAPGIAPKQAETTTAMPSDTAAEQQAITSPIKKRFKHAKRHTPKASYQDSYGRSWVVQMGSFKNKSNAMQLTAKLRSAGFKAFTYDVRESYGTRTRVFIGPEANRAVAQNVLNKVAARLNMQGYIVAYHTAD